MARNRFGGDAATWFVQLDSTGAYRKPKVAPVLTLWSGDPDDLDRVMYDDLRAVDDPTTVINSITGLANGTTPEFLGPDDESVTRMWISPDGGVTGTWITTTTLSKAAASGQFADLEGTPAIPATAADVGAVPTTRKINGKALSADVTLAAGDVGAATAAQGAKADSAVQPADMASKLDVSKVGAAGGVAPLDGSQKLPEANVPDRLSQVQLAAAIGSGIDAKKGAVNGIAPLGADGKVPSSNLPPGQGGSGGTSATARFPLYIPTFDKNPSVTHPSVLHVPGGWHGYEYWMAYTPYPQAPRELPSIAASHDGITWEVPTGLTNPLVTAADAAADGYQWWNDPALCLSADGTTLMLYFGGVAPGVKNELLRMTSTDGVTWSARQVVITQAQGWGASAAVVTESDGTYSMFYHADYINKRTSADGITWSAPTVCTIPTLPAPYALWHLDVTKVGGTYHALVAASTANEDTDPYRLFHWTSADGVTWTGDIAPSVPLTGTRFDKRGHYRSSLQPAASGKAGRFDVWLPLMDDYGADHAHDVHRLAIIRDFDFSDGTTWAFPETPSGYTADFDSADQEWVMASAIRTISGSGAAGLLHNWPTYVLPESPAGTHVATVSFPPPPREWSKFAIDILMVNPGSATGNVAFRAAFGFADTITALKDGTLNSPPGIPVAAQDMPFWGSIVTDSNPIVVDSQAVTSLFKMGAPLRVWFQRSTSTNAGDTFTDAIHIIALRLRRV